MFCRDSWTWIGAISLISLGLIVAARTTSEELAEIKKQFAELQKKLSKL